MHARVLRSRLACQLHSSRGFTLIELMVAMTGGLFVSLAVMALSRDFSRYNQQQMRVSNATLSSSNGFERLSNDISRAGHMVTPNITRDPRVCNKPVSGWPDVVANLRAITLEDGSADVANTEISRAGISPMAIRIAGALDVAEELTTTAISNASGDTTVAIRLSTPAASRLGIVDSPAADDANAAILRSVFMPGGVGRIIRISQNDGLEQYGLVADVESDPVPRLVLASLPAIKFRASTTDAQCGVLGLCTGCSVNVVNVIRYRLKPMLGSTDYAKLFAASGVGGTSGGLPYESGRVELVRDELDPNGDDDVTIDGTEELVAEYAVDLQFWVDQITSASVRTLIQPDPSTITDTYTGTQLIRGVHARLSVRSREADRDADVAGAEPGQYRIQIVGAGGTTATGPFARVRTVQADIDLRNLEGANWD